MKLLPYILFEKYISYLALEMASLGNRHCANCIGTFSFPMLAARRGAKNKSRDRQKHRVETARDAAAVVNY